MRMRKVFLLAMILNLIIPLGYMNTKVHASETDENAEINKSDDKSPMMGWSSWNAFRIDIDEDMIKEQADIMAENGMKEAGYDYINIDDGFFGGRDEEGVLYANDKFPNGMKSIADYIHDKGFKAGIYTDAGITRCAARYDDDPNFPEGGGTYGYRDIDFDTFINDWGYDFIKVDWCGGEIQKLDPEEEYTDIGEKITEAAAEAGRDIAWEICNWAFPGEWATNISSHWRISQDIEPKFYSIVDIIDKNVDLAEHASPGHYNHMDMLQVGNGMSYEEDKSHFSMWAIMASPLLTGNDLRDMSEETLEILTNEEVIAVNQDPLGLQAERVKKEGQQEVYLKPIEDYESGAIALFNRGNEPAEISVNWEDIGLEGPVSVRDLWSHEDKGEFEESYTAEVPAHGIVMLKVNVDDLLVNSKNIDFDKNTSDDIIIDKVGNKLNFIENDDQKLVEGDDYRVEGNQVIFLRDYLQNLPEGKVTLKINYDDDRNQTVVINVSDVPYTSENLGSANSQTELAKVFDGNLESDSGEFPFSSNQLPADKEVNIQYNFKEKVTLNSIEFTTNYGQDQGIKKFKLAAWDEGTESWKTDDKEYELKWTPEGETEPGETLKIDLDSIETSKIKIIITDAGLRWGNKIAMRQIDFDYKTADSDVDTSDLEDLIEEAEAISNDDGEYTEDSYAMLQTAINTAQNAVEEAESDDDVEAAITALESVIDGLEKTEEPTDPEPETPDTSDLKDLIEEAEAISNDDGEYTEDSYAMLQTAIDTAQNAVEEAESDDDVEAALTALQSAIDGLETTESGTGGSGTDNSGDNESEQGKKLPTTATNNYKMLLVGVVLLVLGASAYLIMRRRNSIKENY